MFRNGDVYVGSYQDGKFNGKGNYYLIQVYTHGLISQDTKGSSKTERETAAECGWQTISIRIAINTMDNIKTTRKMVMESTNGKMERAMKESF